MMDHDILNQEFYITRHGKTNHNEFGIIGDDSATLTEEGITSAKELGFTYKELFSDSNNVHLVSSGLPRAYDTARYMAGEGPRIHMEGRINERISGALWNQTGKHAGEILNPSDTLGDHTALKKHATEPAITHILRIREGINQQLEMAGKKTPVFVSHLKTMLELAEMTGNKVERFENTTLYHFVPPETNGQPWAIYQVSLEQGKIVEQQVKTKQITSTNGIQI